MRPSIYPNVGTTQSQPNTAGSPNKPVIAASAWLLLKAIAVAINLFWFGRFSAAPAAVTDNTLGIGVACHLDRQ